MDETVDGRLKQLEALLDNYLSAQGLPKGCPEATTNEATNILELTPERLSRLTPQECGEAAFTLTQYGFYVQKLANREKTTEVWAEESLKKLLCPKMPDCRGYSYDERKWAALRQDDVAPKLEQIRVHARLRYESLAFLSAKIDAMAKVLMGLRRNYDAA